MPLIDEIDRFEALRHTFGTHAAFFGVNPWRLQTWPEAVHAAAAREIDPDKRILAMLAARSLSRGSHVAATTGQVAESAASSAA